MELSCLKIFRPFFAIVFSFTVTNSPVLQAEETTPQVCPEPATSPITTEIFKAATEVLATQPTQPTQPTQQELLKTDSKFQEISKFFTSDSRFSGPSYSTFTTVEGFREAQTKHDEDVAQRDEKLIFDDQLVSKMKNYIDDFARPASFKEIVDDSNVILIGEKHGNRELHSFLARSAGELKDLGVTHIAFELPASDQAIMDEAVKLDRVTHKIVSSFDLEATELVAPPTLLELAILFKRKGISPVSIDSDAGKIFCRDYSGKVFSGSKEQEIKQMTEFEGRLPCRLDPANSLRCKGRDCGMAQNIKSILEANPDAKIVFLVGAMHSANDDHGLPSHLRKVSPSARVKSVVGLPSTSWPGGKLLTKALEGRSDKQFYLPLQKLKTPDSKIFYDGILSFNLGPADAGIYSKDSYAAFYIDGNKSEERERLTDLANKLDQAIIKVRKLERKNYESYRSYSGRFGVSRSKFRMKLSGKKESEILTVEVINESSLLEKPSRTYEIPLFGKAFEKIQSLEPNNAAKAEEMLLENFVLFELLNHALIVPDQLKADLMKEPMASQVGLENLKPWINK